MNEQKPKRTRRQKRSVELENNSLYFEIVSKKYGVEGARQFIRKSKIRFCGWGASEGIPGGNGKFNNQVLFS